MTIANTTSKLYYTANGSQTVFPYTFKIFNDSDLIVVLRDTNGDETTVTNYSVSGAGNDSGGNITFTTAPANGKTVVIRRVLPETQETDYVENSAFLAESHEDALDKLTMIDIQQSEQLGRSVKYPVTDSTELSTELPASVDRASKYFAFDAYGQPIATQYSTDTAIVSTWGEDLINQASAASARTYMGLGSSSIVDTTATVSGGDNIPTDAAVKTYVDAEISSHIDAAVEYVVRNKTADFTLSASELTPYDTYTNYGASGTISGTLPAPTGSGIMKLNVMENQIVYLFPEGTGTIRYGSDQSIAGGYVRSTSNTGSYIELIDNNEEWIITRTVGDWYLETTVS